MSDDYRLSTVCRKCGATIEYPARFAGKRAGCKFCGNVLNLPMNPFIAGNSTDQPLTFEVPIPIASSEEIDFKPIAEKTSKKIAEANIKRPCRNCLHEIEQNSNRCPKCGTYSPFSSTGTPNAYVAALIVTILICCGICSGCLLYTSDAADD